MCNVTCRARNSVELKKKDVKQQTEEMLMGQNKLGLQRRTVHDLQVQLLEVQESKKVAVTGITGEVLPLNMHGNVDVS